MKVAQDHHIIFQETPSLYVRALESKWSTAVMVNGQLPQKLECFRYIEKCGAPKTEVPFSISNRVEGNYKNSFYIYYVR